MLQVRQGVSRLGAALLAEAMGVGATVAAKAQGVGSQGQPAAGNRDGHLHTRPAAFHASCGSGQNDASRRSTTPAAGSAVQTAPQLKSVRSSFRAAAGSLQSGVVSVTSTLTGASTASAAAMAAASGTSLAGRAVSMMARGAVSSLRSALGPASGSSPSLGAAAGSGATAAWGSSSTGSGGQDGCEATLQMQAMPVPGAGSTGSTGPWDVCSVDSISRGGDQVSVDLSASYYPCAPGGDLAEDEACDFDHIEATGYESGSECLVHEWEGSGAEVWQAIEGGCAPHGAKRKVE